MKKVFLLLSIGLVLFIVSCDNLQKKEVVILEIQPWTPDSINKDTPPPTIPELDTTKLKENFTAINNAILNAAKNNSNGFPNKTIYAYRYKIDNFVQEVESFEDPNHPTRNICLKVPQHPANQSDQDCNTYPGKEGNVNWTTNAIPGGRIFPLKNYGTNGCDYDSPGKVLVAKTFDIKIRLGSVKYIVRVNAAHAY